MKLLLVLIALFSLTNINTTDYLNKRQTFEQNIINNYDFYTLNDYSNNA